MIFIFFAMKKLMITKNSVVKIRNLVRNHRSWLVKSNPVFWFWKLLMHRNQKCFLSPGCKHLKHFFPNQTCLKIEQRNSSEWTNEILTKEKDDFDIVQALYSVYTKTKLSIFYLLIRVFRVLFWGGWKPPSCLKLFRIMLEISNLACKYTQI